MWLLTLMTVLLVLVGVPPVSAAPVPRVAVNGVELQFDVPPIIENGRTLVPMRAIFEALGAEIYWNAETRTVSAARGEVALAVQIGNPWANVNDEPVALDVPARIVDGRTLVPLRFVSEALGATVAWDPAAYTVTITDVGATPPPPRAAGDPSLVGFWATSLHTHRMVDLATGLPVGDAAWSGEWYHFRPDGTFRQIVGGCGQFLCGVGIVNGRYEVSGSTILLTDLRQDWLPTPPRPGQSPAYQDRPKADTSLKFSIAQDGALHVEDAVGFTTTLYPAPGE